MTRPVHCPDCARERGVAIPSKCPHTPRPVVTCAITGCGATTLWPPAPPPTGSPAWGDLPGVGRLCPTCSARLFPAASRGL